MPRPFVPTVFWFVGLLWLNPVQIAHGQTIVAGCPKVGTVVKGHDNAGDFTRIYQGTDPADPSLCISSKNSAKPVSRLYNWYDLTNWSMPEGFDEARAGLTGLLSGRIDHFTFQRTSAHKVGAPTVASYTDEWKRLGNITLSIGNRTIDAVVLQVSSEGGAGSWFSGTWDMAYDPVTKVFVKGHLSVRRGSTDIYDFSVTSISAP